jgi:hypothetical protein
MRWSANSDVHHAVLAQETDALLPFGRVHVLSEPAKRLQRSRGAVPSARSRSFDNAIRRMGARNWQQLHNAIYVIGALAIVHYLLSPDIYPEQYLMSGIFFWLRFWRALNLYGLETNVGGIGSHCRRFRALYGAARNRLDLSLSGLRGLGNSQHLLHP